MLATTMPVMGAMIGALTLFSTLVWVGGRVIRLLRLPVDLPEGCRFEPRPPPMRGGDDAPDRAAAWRERREICDLAHEAWRAAIATQGLAAELSDPDRPVGDAERGALVESAKACATEAEAAAERAATAMHDEDPAAARSECESAREAADRARETLRDRIATLPPAPTRRRGWWVLLVLLLVTSLWLLIGLPMLLDHLSP